MSTTPSEPNTPLSEAERTWRRQVVDETRASTALEGGSSTSAMRELQEQWIDGRITADELVAGARKPHPSAGPR
jgi:hypothetical protein